MVSLRVLPPGVSLAEVIKGSYLDWHPEGWSPHLAVHNNSIEDYEDRGWSTGEVDRSSSYQKLTYFDQEEIGIEA